jgi:hypothetical protein
MQNETIGLRLGITALLALGRFVFPLLFIPAAFFGWTIYDSLSLLAVDGPQGPHHKQALCAVATRIGKVLRTGKPYELRDNASKPISVAEGRVIVAKQFTIPAETRNARRRHRTGSVV